MNFLQSADRFTRIVTRNLLATAIGGAVLITGLKLLLPPSNAQAAVSAEANCAESKDVAAIICSDPGLLALRDEMNQAAQRAGQIYRYNSEAQRVLKALAPQLVGMRNAAAGSDGVGLDELMMRQRDFLTALATPRSGETGRWVNALGALEVKETPHGLVVEMSASEPARGEWRCDLRSRAGRQDGGILIAEGDHAMSESLLSGWTLRARREGVLLRIEEVAPAGAAEPPYCNGGGGFAGLYFPAR